MKTFFLFSVSAFLFINSLYANNITINLEETDAGVRASYSGSFELTSLTSVDPGDFVFFGEGESGPFTGFRQAQSLALVFGNVLQTENLLLYEGEADFGFAFILQDGVFSTNVIEQTGDSFGFRLAGTDIPLFQIILPADYVSGDSIEGSMIFSNLILAEVEAVCGIYALDRQINNTITFLIDSKPLPFKITDFSYDAENEMASLSFQGKSHLSYKIRSSEDLDFSNSQKRFINSVTVGSQIFGDEGFSPDDSGNATVAFSLNRRESSFLRVEIAFFSEFLEF